MRGSKHGLNRDEWRMRATEFTPMGRDLPQSKLDEDTVRAIRRNKYGWPRHKWASLLGLHLQTIDKVCTYETWRHVE